MIGCIEDIFLLEFLISPSFLSNLCFIWIMKLIKETLNSSFEKVQIQVYLWDCKEGIKSNGIGSTSKTKFQN